MTNPPPPADPEQPSAEPATPPHHPEQRAAPTQPSDRKSSKKPSIKAVARGAVEGAVSAAVSTAVVGAASGGSGTVAAAGLGALKGAAVASVQSRAGRNTLIVLLVIALISGFAVPIGITALAALNVTATQQALNNQVSSTSLDLTPSEATTLEDTTSGTVVPWELIVVGQDLFDERNPGWRVADLADVLLDADPSARWLDPREGLVWVNPASYRAPTEADADHETLAARQERVHQNYLTALTDFGLSEEEAESVWADLQDAIRGSQACPVPPRPSDNPGGNEGHGDGLGNLSTSQTNNVRTIIGIARTMGGDNWEHLALTALTVGYTETRWRVLANDGVIDHDYERSRLREYPADLYPVAATSLDYPHDGVGSQYVALGMFQQMMNGRWGSAGASTYATDPDAVIARLMTADWATYAFLNAAMQVPGWETMDPAELGETVQVSGNGSATQRNLAIARDALEQYSDSPAVPLPDGAAGETPPGAQPNGTKNQCGANAPQVGTGEFVWPVPSGTLSSTFGWRVDPVTGSFSKLHAGIDISAGCYEPIVAIDGGTVTQTGQEPYGAYQIWIDHGNGYLSRYVHMEADGVYVQPGDTVARGDVIGGIGSSGWSTGCHLHMEVHKDGVPIDPMTVLGSNT